MAQIKIYAGDTTVQQWQRICQKFTNNSAAFAVMVAEYYSNHIQEEPMFILESTDKPYTGVIPDSAWHEINRFEKLQDAETAIGAKLRAMHERCGANSWDDHYRLIPTADIQMTAVFYCTGSILLHHPADNCQHSAEVHYTWHAGEARPRAPYPDGWPTPQTCPACDVADQHELAKTSAHV